MNLEKLKIEYNHLKDHYDEVKAIDFIKKLTESNDKEIITFHFDLLKDNENEYLFYEIRGDFDKHGTVGKDFLLKKLDTEINPDLKAEALFIVGAMESLELTDIIKIKETAKKFIQTKNSYKNQYYGIIVLGWIGKKTEIAILETELLKNENSQLRNYAASALRQIWFYHPKLKKSILKVYDKALSSEIDDEVNKTIIACVQDILRKKFGIKESQYGEISGDVHVAKSKAIKVLRKSLS